MKPVLQARAVHKSYAIGKQQIPVLRGVDLEVQHGEKVALLGAPSCRIKLNGPVEAVGPYGLCVRVETIDLRLDEPERFIEQMQETGRVSSPDSPGPSEAET